MAAAVAIRHLGDNTSRDTTARDPHSQQAAPKRVLLFCNGDRFFKGKKVYIVPNRYNNFTDLLNDLTGKLPHGASLPYGVRQIFTPQHGKKVRKFEDLQDGQCYVCAGFEHFRNMDYGSYALPTSQVPQRRDTKVEGGKPQGRPAVVKIDPTKEKSSKPKTFTVILNSVRPRKISKVSFSRNQLSHFEQLMREIQQSFGSSGTKARRLYTIKGQEVHSVGDFFRLDSQLIALGSEKFTTSDLKEILTELFPGQPSQAKTILKQWEKRRGAKKAGRSSAGKPPKPLESQDVKSSKDSVEDPRKVDQEIDPGTVQPDGAVPEDGVKKRDSGYYEAERTAPSVPLPREATPPQSIPEVQPQPAPLQIPEKVPKTKAPVVPEPIRSSPEVEPITARHVTEPNETAILKVTTSTHSSVKPVAEEMEPAGPQQPATKEIEASVEPTQQDKQPSQQDKQPKSREDAVKQPVKEEPRVNLKKPHEAAQSPDESPVISRKPPAAAPGALVNRTGQLDADLADVLSTQAIPKLDNVGMNKFSVLPQIAAEAPPSQPPARGGKAEPMNRSLSVPETRRERDAGVLSPPPLEHEAKLAPEEEVDHKSVRPLTPASAPGRRVPGKLSRQVSKAEYISQRFDYGRVLGDGNFAIVRRSKRKKTGQECALKIIDKSKLKGKYHMVENEIRLQGMCDHVNLVKLYEQYETEKEIFLIMELVHGGDLFDTITTAVKFDEKNASSMVKDIAEGLFYLHSRNIVHRDIKPENLMVEPGRGGTPTIKLGDFGLAMEVAKPIYTVCGTPTYVAPEILAEKGYGVEVDCWALGVITYILLSGFPPFRSAERRQSELFEMIKKGKFVFLAPYWDLISGTAKDLIARLLVVDRKKRYTTVETLCHPWVLSRGGSIPLPGDLPTHRLKMKQQYNVRAKENMTEWGALKARESKLAHL